MGAKTISKPADLQFLTLEGPFTVAYRKEAGKWLAIVLQFDLVGIASTKDEALNELRVVFELYLDAVLESTGRVRFFNPSDASEWQIRDQESFRVTLVVMNGSRRLPSGVKLALSQFQTLRPLRKSVVAVHLAPAAA